MAQAPADGPNTTTPGVLRARRWALAVIAAVAAVALRALLQPALGDQLPFVVAFPVLALAASAWGIEAGLVVTVVSALAVALPEVPPGIAPAEQPLQVGLFLLTATLISLGCGLRRSSRNATEDVARREGGAAIPESPLAVWLRAVLWGSVLVPLAGFLVAAWWGYEHARVEARDAALRASALVAGHAERTFAIAEQIARHADQMSGGTDEQVRQREYEIHQRLSDMAAGLPSVLNLNIWDASGHPLVRSDRYPVDVGASVADRGYFREQQAGDVPVGVSEIITGRQSGFALMNATIRRTSTDGRFIGVVAVSLSPEFFRDYFRSLAKEDPRLASFALVRTDGAVLATWPRAAAADARVPADDEILARVRTGASADSRLLESRADAEARFVSFQRVGAYPLYVVAGFSRAAMLAGWLRFVGTLAAVLAPVTAGLAWVSLVALRKTRREQAMALALGEAMRVRSAAEKSALETQKLQTLAQLTGGVAHDFNNLLAIISSSLHIHRHLHPELAQERHLDALARAVQSGARLTRQLLSFSRKQALRPETIELQSWLPASEGLVRSTLGARVEMHVEVDAEVAPVAVDVAELELALINLALNARHAMPDGGQLIVRAHDATVSDGLGATVVIAVTDTGVGIPADVLPHVFEPFFTTRTREVGSGLGLSQVHGFCAQAGGFARILSTPGAGTTVEMHLPARARRPPPPPDDPRVASTRLAGWLLMVEDNEEVASSTAAIIEAAGMKVDQVPTADAALAWLQRAGVLPDLVLSDIEMPGSMNGLALALRLRERHPALPVILVTGYAKQLDEAVAGGLRVLSKPVPPNDLLRELAAALGQTAGVALRTSRAAG